MSETLQEHANTNPHILQRLNDMEKMGATEKDHDLFTIHLLIQKNKIKNIAVL